jgi:hypothetical protein
LIVVYVEWWSRLDSNPLPFDCQSGSKPFLPYFSPYVIRFVPTDAYARQEFRGLPQKAQKPAPLGDFLPQAKQAVAGWNTLSVIETICSRVSWLFRAMKDIAA